jgi:hypothetical protein
MLESAPGENKMTPCPSPPSNLVLPILSLIVAALAVFFGPLITLKMSERQIELSRRIASKQIVAPMRQAWVNTFREKLSELTGSAFHYWNMRSITRGTVELNEDEQRRLVQIEHEIGLFINPTEPDHRELMKALERVLGLLDRGTDEKGEFNPALHKATMLGQKIFKTEWNRIKDDIEKV